MKRVAVLSAAALMAAASLVSTGAEARGRRGAGVAAGVVGGLAIGALLGSALSARSAPVYVYESPAYPPPVIVHSYPRYDYDDGYPRGYVHGYVSGYRDGYWDGDADRD